jgi:hypothetical protein
VTVSTCGKNLGWLLVVVAALGITAVMTSSEGEPSDQRRVVCLVVLTNGQRRIDCSLVIRTNRTYELRRFENGVFSNSATGTLSQATFQAARDAVRIPARQGGYTYQPLIGPNWTNGQPSLELILQWIAETKRK